jgi:hypothetical protein
MEYVRAFLCSTLVSSMVVFGILAPSHAADRETRTVHTYGNVSGVEIANVIAIDITKLAALIPAGYDILPAAAVGFGRQDQGVLAIANFRGLTPVVDGRSTGREQQVAVDVGILVAQPSEAAAAGVDIPGASHFYTLTIYSNDARYVASLRDAGMPVRLRNIIYDRMINDATGIGDLTVAVQDSKSHLASYNIGLTLAPAIGAFNAVFWYNGIYGTAVLHFKDEPFQMGSANSQIYALDSSKLGNLLAGGGLGSCASADIGSICVKASSLNLLYPQGTVGSLLLIEQKTFPTADRE